MSFSLSRPYKAYAVSPLGTACKTQVAKYNFTESVHGIATGDFYRKQAIEECVKQVQSGKITNASQFKPAGGTLKPTQKPTPKPKRNADTGFEGMFRGIKSNPLLLGVGALVLIAVGVLVGRALK